MTGLEILDRLLLGQIAHHRRPDAWDLIDEQGLVAAVLCPRGEHVSISPLPKRIPPARDRRGIVPYGETVMWTIRPDNIEEGLEQVRRLAAGTPAP